MVPDSQHLVVIRGNSASGKSTLARELQLVMGRGTANIGQDYFRRVVLREHDVPGGDNIDLIARTAEHCLSIGYHVILEGIFFARHYGKMLRSLIESHTGPSHVFYLDTPFDETLRRHATRPLCKDVDATMLRGWYVPADVLATPGEVILEGTTDADETLRVVQRHVGTVVPPRAREAATRFL